ncbi:MAG TPA: cell division protein FtsL [Steroidobacteraceae bacterium]|nr:cell division protein FtsL [Steroidobacteraceae bacterium]
MSSLLRNQWFIAAVLWCAVLVSAAGAVYVRHRAREQFVELERLNRERDQLQVTWGQLQLEQSAWSSNAYVESVAIAQLKMAPPDPAAIRVVMP